MKRLAAALLLAALGSFVVVSVIRHPIPDRDLSYMCLFLGFGVIAVAVGLWRER